MHSHATLIDCELHILFATLVKFAYFAMCMYIHSPQTQTSFFGVSTYIFGIKTKTQI